MDMLWVGVVLGVVATSFVVLTALIARAGSLDRAFFGLTLAGRAKADPSFGERLAALVAGSPMPLPPSSAPIPVPTSTSTKAVPTAPPAPVKPLPPRGEAYRLLSMLQTEARLLDFLLEDISAAPDLQIGQAVKEIHRKSAQVLKDHLTLGVVLAGADGDSVTVPAGFDPSHIRLVGNVTGKPPYTGTLLHPGWRVKEAKIPAIPEGQDPTILQPAEVELS